MTLFETKGSMNTEQKKAWSKIRNKGITRYILIDGVLKAGGTFAVVMYLFDFLYELLSVYWFNISASLSISSPSIFNFDIISSHSEDCEVIVEDI